MMKRKKEEIDIENLNQVIILGRKILKVLGGKKGGTVMENDYATGFSIGGIFSCLF